MSVYQNLSVQVVCIELRSRPCILRVAAVNKLTMGLPLREPTTEKTKARTIQLEPSNVSVCIIKLLFYIFQTNNRPAVAASSSTFKPTPQIQLAKTLKMLLPGKEIQTTTTPVNVR